MSALGELEIFTTIVEEESFTDAADVLGVSKSHVSKQLRRLEDRLGARLLNRTTRQQSLTDVGAAFYERCRQILDDLEEAEQAVNRMQTAPHGTLRLTVPMSFGINYLAEATTEFMREHEALKVELSFADRVVDLIAEGFDLAVRIGVLEDSGLMARKLADMERFIVASPGYLEEHGAPTSLDDLDDHECLLYSYQRTGASWPLRGPDGTEKLVRVDGRFRANNGDALLEAARCGIGLAFLPDFITAGALERGELVTVLDEWVDDRPAIWALYPHTRHLSAKVRLYIDFLVERFGPVAPWTRKARGESRPAEE
jgi:DNA-binding transcriptional LysR family regulator